MSQHAPSDFAAPLKLTRRTVPDDWVDYNGHMNDACYAVAFSSAIDALMDRIGLDEAGRATTGHTIYTLAVVIRYVKEVKKGEPIAVDAQLLESDAKRLRVWLTLTHAGTGDVLATSEQLLLCIDTSGPKASSWPHVVAQAVSALAEAHAGLPMPDEAGQGISLRRRR
jgi:acyl-CoA thioester hydrolase